MIFKLSFSKLYKPVFQLAIIAVILIGFGLIEGGGFNISAILEVIYSTGGLVGKAVLSIIFLPTIYLCVVYYLLTRNKTIEINPDYIEIKNVNGNNTRYLVKDLTLIKLYKSKGGAVMSTADMFYRAELFTKDGNKIILTSVLEPSLEEALGLL